MKTRNHLGQGCFPARDGRTRSGAALLLPLVLLLLAFLECPLQTDGFRAKQKQRALAKMKMKTKTKMTEGLNPSQFLVISSPMEKKICYAEIVDFKSKTGVVSPLIDSGLLLPMGLAIDKVRSFLYVADLDLKKIVRYTLMVQSEPQEDGTVKRTLMTDGVQLTIIEGVEPRWVAVDPQRGHLYFTDQANDSVNKLDYGVIEKIEAGEWTAGDLLTVEEKEEEALAAAQEARRLQLKGQAAMPPPDPKPEIKRLYSGSEHAGISRPAGLATNGVQLIWGNEATGTTQGSVVEGETDPKVSPVAPTANADSGAETGVIVYPKKLSSNTNKVFGVTLTHNAVIYTDNSQYVYGVRKGGGEVVTFTSGLEKPRGIAWDGDGTIYVADQAGNMVYCFASGSLKPTSISRVVGLHDAFGLALLSEEDPAFGGAMPGAAAVATGPLGLGPAPGEGIIPAALAPYWTIETLVAEILVLSVASYFVWKWNRELKDRGHGTACGWRTVCCCLLCTPVACCLQIDEEPPK